LIHHQCHLAFQISTKKTFRLKGIAYVEATEAAASVKIYAKKNIDN
jgi:hypothetical protein